MNMKTIGEWLARHNSPRWLSLIIMSMLYYPVFYFEDIFTLLIASTWFGAWVISASSLIIDAFTGWYNSMHKFPDFVYAPPYERINLCLVIFLICTMMFVIVRASQYVEQYLPEKSEEKDE